MGICFFNSARVWGGGEKWHFDVCKALREAGTEVVLAVNPQSSLARRAQVAEIPVFAIKVGNLSLLDPAALLRVYRFFKTRRIDTVIMNLPADLKLAGVAARLAGVRRIIYRRGSAIAVRPTLLNRFLFRNVITEVIANSQETGRTILQHAPDLIEPSRIHVLYNGIDTAKFIPDLPQERTVPILGNAGRLVHQKGQDLLIEAASILAKSGTSFRMVIAGEGKLRLSLEQHRDRSGLSGQVEFRGFVEDIGAFMRSIDIFVCPSRWEGFGYVIAEAMACAKPVVAFDVSSNPELIENGRTGILVPAFDVSALAGVIRDLCRDRRLCRELGENARRKAIREFDRTVTMSRVMKFLAAPA